MTTQDRIDKAEAIKAELSISADDSLRHRCMWWLKGWQRKHQKMSILDGRNVIKIQMRALAAVERSLSEFPPSNAEGL